MLENEEYRQTAPLVNSSGDTIVLPSHRKNRRRPCFSSFDNTEALLSHSYFPQCNVPTPPLVSKLKLLVQHVNAFMSQYLFFIWPLLVLEHIGLRKTFLHLPLLHSICLQLSIHTPQQVDSLLQPYL